MGRFVRGSIVVTNFPFSGLSGAKRRPSLVIADLDGEIVLCQITSRQRLDRYAIHIETEDYIDGRLMVDSVIRPNKIFTADENLILYSAGKIGEEKINKVIQAIVGIMHTKTLITKTAKIDRAQCVVVRGNKILTVKHREKGREWFCLPGGAVEEGETPEEAAARELKEECLVEGSNFKLISMVSHDGHVNHTFYADIGTQEPVLGKDPEVSGSPILVGVEWQTLDSLCERDRAYMWSAGLIYCSEFDKELISWGDDISYPKRQERNDLNNGN